MENKKGNIVVVAIIIVIVAITFGAIGWLIARKTQAPVQNIQTAAPQPSMPVVQTQPNTTISETTPATQPETTPSTNNLQNNITQANNKVAIFFTIKDQKGNLLKGIECDVTTNNKSNTKMIVISSKRSNAAGECNFQGLDPANPYLVQVYWTKDKSRESSISLSWINPGTTITRTIVKPIGY